MAVTTKELAKICGISRTTVSRALNGHGRIDAQTKALIIETAKQQGYRPDLLARSLVKGRTMCLGIIVFDISNSYFAQMVSAIEAEARKNGYFLNITLQEKDKRLEIELINNMVDRRMDGIILCPVNKGRKFSEFLQGLHTPLLVLGNFVSDKIPFIGINERQAARDAVALQIGKGYRRIVFVCPPLCDAARGNIYTHQQRILGVADGIKDCSGVDLAVIDRWNYLELLDQWIDGRVKTSFFCSGDVFALDIMSYLKRKYSFLPPNIGVMGFDNTRMLQYFVPSIATVDTSINETGRLAAMLLIKKINGESIPKRSFASYRILDGESI
ncbi:MAG: LacI family transcriptional regulator [Treponema sp.]|nr:LacI family transcriptional regulator [Treponema sp.]